MDLKTIVEYATLGGGIIAAVAGAFTTIRGKLRDDKVLQDKAGVTAVEQSKLMQDIAINMQNTYLQRVQQNADLLEEELERTKRRLQQCLEEKDAKLERPTSRPAFDVRDETNATDVPKPESGSD